MEQPFILLKYEDVQTSFGTDSPAMASCKEGLPPHSPHGRCWVGNWAHHIQTLKHSVRLIKL